MMIKKSLNANDIVIEQYCPAIMYLAITKTPSELERILAEEGNICIEFLLDEWKCEKTDQNQITFDHAKYKSVSEDNHHPGQGNSEDLLRDGIEILEKFSSACKTAKLSELVYDFYRKETSPYHQHLQEAIKFSGVPENHLTESDCFIGVLESLYNQLIEYFDKKGDEENFKKITEYQKELEDLIQVREEQASEFAMMLFPLASIVKYTAVCSLDTENDSRTFEKRIKDSLSKAKDRGFLNMYEMMFLEELYRASKTYNSR